MVRSLTPCTVAIKETIGLATRSGVAGGVAVLWSFSQSRRRMEPSEFLNHENRMGMAWGEEVHDVFFLVEMDDESVCVYAQCVFNVQILQ